MISRLFVSVLGLLPQHGISRVIHALARWRWSPWKRLLIGSFIRLYPVDLTEARASDPAEYPSFNAFFTRELRDDARPLATAPDRIISPVDGAVSEFGNLSGNRLLQAKGVDYSLQALLAGDDTLAKPFVDGHFATLYLSPSDYHRVHLPINGTLQRMLHVPGRLYGVSKPVVQHLPGLFARNERVICEFSSAAGRFMLIFVGAIGVGSIETVWEGEITPPRGERIRSWDYRQHPVGFAAGDEIGRFNLGSTIILLFEKNQVIWDAGLSVDAPVRLGMPIGRLGQSGTPPIEGHHLSN
ncbi:archaetidylserine decarboxylase [Spiribacter salilacus]|uniref:archaetidylserine decarboxylase n=1 Tax=Spiribacter salilacus TaxID=2664894 RepID=UPI00350E563A